MAKGLTGTVRSGWGRALLLTGLVLGSGLGLGWGFPRAARAQSLEAPAAHQGYYFGVGYHLAFNRIWQDDNPGGLWPGGDLAFRVGQLVTRRFGLGLQLHTGSAKGAGQTATLFGLELEAQWELRRNLSIHGGLGLDVVSVSTDSDQKKSLRGTAGSGYFLALSYSWFFTHRLTGGWAVTPRVEGRYVPGDSASALIGVVGVEICYWTGLPRNQLELPLSEAFKKQP